MADSATDPGCPTDSMAGLAMQPCDVVLVGAGPRARAWLAPLRRSARLRPVATVAHADGPAADLPHYRALTEAMGVYPAAVFAVALPPHAALESALQLAEAGRAGVVQAPLHDGLLDAELEPASAAVRVAHGWVTLSGVRAVEAVMRRVGGGHAQIEVAGLPEEERADPYEALVHAAALVRTLLPQATPSAARYTDGGAVEVELTAPAGERPWSARLRVLPQGRRISIRVEGTSQAALWRWEADRESVMLRDRMLVAPRTTPAAEVRALAQLLPDGQRGDGLREAADVLRLARRCRSLLPTHLALGARAFRQSASIAQRRPHDLLGRLGLRGTLDGEEAMPTAPALAPPPPEPLELWAFRAGIKPVAFLTVRPDDVERTLAWFGAAHCERRERRVHVEAQDHWTDRRDQGEPRVELYIARDAALARRMAHLQAEADPSAAIRELGALSGYPSCCVDAFARQDDRANNSRNRYHSQARTLAPDGTTPVPWPWELNNLYTMTVPFYPCTYRCDRALAWARTAFAEMARAHPASVEELRVALARPVLYFDHEHQLVLDGVAEGSEGPRVQGSKRERAPRSVPETLGPSNRSAMRIAYRAVALPQCVSAQCAALAAAIGRGDRLSLDDRQLLVQSGGQTVLRLERTDPALGFVAPFGAPE
jgi:hypothetical protein